MLYYFFLQPFKFSMVGSKCISIRVRVFNSIWFYQIRPVNWHFISFFKAKFCVAWIYVILTMMIKMILPDCDWGRRFQHMNRYYWLVLNEILRDKFYWYSMSWIHKKGFSYISQLYINTLQFTAFTCSDHRTV